MFSPRFTNKAVIFAFMILVGFTLAKGFYSGSTIAVVLSTISFAAGVYFIHLLHKAKELSENEEAMH